MNRKNKAVLFSTIFLSMSTFTVQAMEQKPRPTRSRCQLTNEEKEAAAARKKEFFSKFSAVDAKEPGNVVLFQSFDVESREFQNVVNFYRNPRDPSDFGKLVEFFESIPQVYKQEAFDHMDSHINRRNQTKMKGLQYTPEGVVVDTPMKIQGAIPLRQKLLQPLFESKEIQLETSDDDF